MQVIYLKLVITIVMPKVAVCMATYNAGEFLEDMLWTLESQTFKDFIVYIWNDGSTDRTKEIIENHKGNLDIKVEHHDGIHNIGTVKKLVVEMALKDNPDYIQMVDSDDALEPTFLEKMLDKIQEVDFVVCDGITFGNRVFEIKNERTTKKKIKDSNPFLSWLMIRADVIKDINYREGMRHFEDWDLHLRLINADKTYDIVDEQLYNYRMHPDQFHIVTDQNFYKHKENLWQINNISEQ